MANIKIVVDGPLMDGHKLTFKAPCNCDVVDKLDVRYIKNDTQASKLFTMKDTHGNDLTGLGNLFYKDSYVSVVLDTVNNFAYLQNAATNKYLEEKMKTSGGGAGAVELTQAEYDNLSEEEKDKDVIYFITDGVSEGNVADCVIECGENYTKWKSGKVECWGMTTTSNGYSKVDLPVEIVSYPYYIIATPVYKSSSIPVFDVSTQCENPAYFYLYTRQATSSLSAISDVSVNWYAVGRWC